MGLLFNRRAIIHHLCGLLQHALQFAYRVSLFLAFKRHTIGPVTGLGQKVVNVDFDSFAAFWLGIINRRPAVVTHDRFARFASQCLRRVFSR